MNYELKPYSCSNIQIYFQWFVGVGRADATSVFDVIIQSRLYIDANRFSQLIFHAGGGMSAEHGTLLVDVGRALRPTSLLTGVDNGCAPLDEFFHFATGFDVDIDVFTAPHTVGQTDGDADIVEFLLRGLGVRHALLCKVRGEATVGESRLKAPPIVQPVLHRKSHLNSPMMFLMSHGWHVGRRKTSRILCR